MGLDDLTIMLSSKNAHLIEMGQVQVHCECIGQLWGSIIYMLYG